jgi:hypothetical protein
MYLKNNYSYPKYDLPVSITCIMWWGCIDTNYLWFIETISNPCQD